MADSTRPPGAFTEEDGHEVHALFASLRREMVQVGRQFRSRVNRSIREREAGRGGGPGLAELVGRTLIEALNMLTRATSLTDDEEDS